MAQCSPPTQHILLEGFTAKPQTSSSLRLLPAFASNGSWLSQALRRLGSCRQHSFSLRIKGSHPLSPHACLPPPESSLLAPAVATVRSGFLGNCCHGDCALSYCANVSHLPPYLVCDMDACKMVRLKTLHLSPLPSKLVHLGQSFLAACFPFLSFLRLPGQSLPMERKS